MILFFSSSVPLFVCFLILVLCLLHPDLDTNRWYFFNICVCCKFSILLASVSFPIRGKKIAIHCTSVWCSRGQIEIDRTDQRQFILSALYVISAVI